MQLDLFGSPLTLPRTGRAAITPRGCTYCTLHGKVNKILGLERIQGRPAMAWAMCPGKNENARRLELVGDAGQLLWDAVATRGMDRNWFDVQNVVRCWPRDPQGANRDPSKQELHCCSIYNEQAFQRNNRAAAVHLVMGRVAQGQLFPRAGKRTIFWDADLDAYVVFARHPSFILRVDRGKRGWHWFEFLDRMNAVRSCVDHPGRYGYVQAQNYGAVTTPAEMRQLWHILQGEARAGRRVGVDIEDDEIDGRRQIIMAAFAWGSYKDERKFDSWKGGARTVVLRHPELDNDPERIKPLEQALAKLMANGKLKKAFQHGSYDVPPLEQQLGAKVEGYDYDSQYATYLHHSNLRSYSLDNIAQVFFPEFGDYKTMVEQYMPHLYNAPLKTLVTYNCADADLTKRAECKTRDHIKLALLRVYIADAFTLDAMEERGPLLDRDLNDRLLEQIPKLLEQPMNSLRVLAENPKFNPGSPPQVAKLLYDKFNLPQIKGRSTDKKVLEILSNKVEHPALKLVQGCRKLSRSESTLKGYAISADNNHGELHTIWWLTGAATGRLRSGKGEAAEAEGIVNLQNVDKNAVFRNLLISDQHWNIALKDPMPREVQDLDIVLKLDQSQAELRALAEMSGDKLLISQFQSGQDVHCLVGHELTGWPVEKIAHDDKVRRTIKNFHFAIVFGVGEDGGVDYMESKGVKITRAKFAEYLNTYFQRYRGVKRLIDRLRQQADTRGYVETLFGFRREIYEDERRNTYTGNQSINSPIQGTAHQFTLIALALLYLEPERFNYLLRPIIEEHDAIYFLVKVRHLREAYLQAKELTEHAAAAYAEREFNLKLQVPLKSEAEVGFNCGSLVEYKGGSVKQALLAWREKYRRTMTNPQLLPKDLAEICIL